MAIVNLSLNLKIKTIYVPDYFYHGMVDSGDDRVVYSEGKLSFNGINVEIGDKNTFDADFEQTVIETKVEK